MAAGDLAPTVRKCRGALIVGTTNAVAKAASRAAGELPSIIDSLGKAITARALPEDQLLNINMRIARSAQGAMVAGYRSRLPRQSISYNSGSRLTGTLGPALESSQMTDRTSSRVISFVNMEYLDGAAKHWYRVNYGAVGPNLSRGETAETFTVNLNNRPFITLRDNRAPSRSNYLPANFFWIKGPVNMLIASRAPAEPGRAKGARAAHFIDLGLEVVADEFGPAYDTFFREFVEDAANRARLTKKGIDVVADTRLSSTGWTVTVG